MIKIPRFNEYNEVSKLFESYQISDAAKRMRRACLVLIGEAPFFGELATKMRFIEDKNLKYHTMATDGFDVYYDPDFVMEHTQREIQWVICHEIMHCVLQHFLRKSSNTDHDRWNAACDYELNLLIDPKDGNENLGDMPKDGLFDKKYKGWSAERIYKDLEGNAIPDPSKWDYGHVMPPDMSKRQGKHEEGDGDGKSGSKATNKCGVGDYVIDSKGNFGKVTSIDDNTGEADITPMTKDQVKASIEREHGVKVYDVL